MNQLRDYILKAGTLLYRYDLVEPPKEWSTEFKNPEYVYRDSGPKNKICGFFFFSSCSQAKNTALCAVQRHPDRTFNGIWITECSIKESVKLLDLRDFQHCTGLLSTLIHHGYDVLTANFKTWGGLSFLEIAEDIQNMIRISLEDSTWFMNGEKSRAIDLAISNVESTLGFPNDHIGALCQLLSDNTNGFPFKALLQEKEYEGYIFNESNHSFESDTLCIFDSNKLGSPKLIYN